MSLAQMFILQNEKIKDLHAQIITIVNKWPQNCTNKQGQLLLMDCGTAASLVCLLFLKCAYCFTNKIYLFI